MRADDHRDEPLKTTRNSAIVAGPRTGRGYSSTGDEAVTSGRRRAPAEGSPLGLSWSDETLAGASPSEHHMRQVSDSNTNETIIATPNRNTLQPVADVADDERPMSARSLDPLSKV